MMHDITLLIVIVFVPSYIMLIITLFWIRNKFNKYEKLIIDAMSVRDDAYPPTYPPTFPPTHPPTYPSPRRQFDLVETLLSNKQIVSFISFLDKNASFGIDLITELFKVKK